MIEHERKRLSGSVHGSERTLLAFTAAACYAGVDFPQLLVQMAEHGDVQPNCGYRSGIRCRWLLGDARHLFEVERPAPRLPWYLSGPAAHVAAGSHSGARCVPRSVPVARPLPESADWLNSFARLLRGSVA